MDYVTAKLVESMTKSLNHIAYVLSRIADAIEENLKVTKELRDLTKQANNLADAALPPGWKKAWERENEM